jgi:RNA polymerase sigma factor (sigma-70 family)
LCLLVQVDEPWLCVPLVIGFSICYIRNEEQKAETMRINQKISAFSLSVCIEKGENRSSQLTFRPRMPILEWSHYCSLKWKVLGIVEQDSSPSEEGHSGKVALSEHRNVLVALYEALPVYASAAFWYAIEESDGHKALPLEVLVRCVRLAVAYGDAKTRNRIIEVIIRRTQIANEHWATNILVRLPAGERAMLADDLYADLCECVIRALLDPKRLFWEANFQHCLGFERQHVYQALMTREGRWNAGTSEVSGVVGDAQSAEAPVHTIVPRRVPRRLMHSMEQPMQMANGETFELLIEDERAQQALQAIEHDELPRLILRLPQKLKAVLWLIFWEGRTEKDTAQVLGISDRTVRNRLREAMKLLRDELESEKDSVYE